MRQPRLHDDRFADRTPPMLLAFQRATRRKTPALVVLVIVSGLLTFLTPPGDQTGLFLLALVILVFAIALTVFAWLPLGHATQEPPQGEHLPPQA